MGAFPIKLPPPPSIQLSTLFFFSFSRKHKTEPKMPVSQQIYASMSILALTSLTGAAVAVGSGIGMFMHEAASQEETPMFPTKAAAHSPKETRSNRGFAA